MSWWGKLVGGALGFALVGPIGALLGAALGHSLDKGVSNLEQDGNSSNEDIQTAFFTASFSIMGYVAKADGRVTESEIQIARDIMQKMQLNEDQKKLAINLFTQGKQSSFNPDEVIFQFKRTCARRSNLLMMFMEIQLSTALADGELHQDEQRVLLHIAELLGFRRRDFEQLLARCTAQRFYSQNHAQDNKPNDRALIHAAYELLGVNESCTDTELKKAYRRSMSQHHPDKLVSKGLPEEMMKLATEKTQEIKDAYERIKQHRLNNI